MQDQIDCLTINLSDLILPWMLLGKVRRQCVWFIMSPFSAHDALIGRLRSLRNTYSIWFSDIARKAKYFRCHPFMSSTANNGPYYPRDFAPMTEIVRFGTFIEDRSSTDKLMLIENSIDSVRCYSTYIWASRAFLA